MVCATQSPYSTRLFGSKTSILYCSFEIAIWGTEFSIKNIKLDKTISGTLNRGRPATTSRGRKPPGAGNSLEQVQELVVDAKTNSLMLEISRCSICVPVSSRFCLVEGLPRLIQSLILQ